MSLRLVLAQYLASLRERNELDALLPELLSAMGHSVLSRPQVGTGQAGVDIASTCENVQDQKEAFLWVLKFGDIRRADLHSGQQGIDASVREACADFAEHRLDATLRSLPLRVIVVSNGSILQEAQAGFTGLVDQVARHWGARVEFWGMDQLTPRIEQHLFDECLLLGSAKSDLRSALATIEETETSFNQFRRFVDRCLVSPDGEEALSIPTRNRNFLRRCAAAAMGLGVLGVWCRAENNLKPAAVAGEYLLLKLWAAAVIVGLQNDPEFRKRIEAVAGVHFDGLQQYFRKVLPTLRSPRAMVRYRRNHVFYTQLLFEELGRLSTLLIAMQFLGAPAESRSAVRQIVVLVVNTHTAFLRPVLDDQGIDLALVLTALMGEGDLVSARALATQATGALDRALKLPQYLPVDTDLIEDAISAQINGSAEPREFFELSTLVPMLATASAFMADEETLSKLRGLRAQMPKVSLEQWWPGSDLETLAATGKALSDIGVSRVLPPLRLTAKEQANDCLSPPSGAASPDAFHWHDTPWEMLVALSARLFRHPLPTWFMPQLNEEAGQCRVGIKNQSHAAARRDTP